MKSHFRVQLCFSGGDGRRRHRRLRDLQRAGHKGGKVLHVPIPEAWESRRGQVEAPAFCSPGPAWLEAHPDRPLLEPDCGCPNSTPTPTPTRGPGGPRPPSLPPGRAAGWLKQVLISSQRRGPLCGEFVSRKGSKPSSIGAYVHRAINRKDLQSSPGPQQPRTLSGITYDDLSHQPGQLSH